jgi:hypothetical protein
MRHEITGYDGMVIPRVKRKRREVRRMLAQHLMRHKDIRRTVNLYLDLGLSELSEQADSLPAVLFPTAGANAATKEAKKAL